MTHDSDVIEAGHRRLVSWRMSLMRAAGRCGSLADTDIETSLSRVGVHAVLVTVDMPGTWVWHLTDADGAVLASSMAAGTRYRHKEEALRGAFAGIVERLSALASRAAA